MEERLEDFAVRVDRLKDGLVLPKPAPSEEPAPPAPPEPEPEPADSGCAFAADSLALRKGSIMFRDFTVGEAPQRFDFAIDNIAARKLALRFDPGGTEPGHVELEAELGGGGKIGFVADVETKQAGPATHSKITISSLPIGGVRVYLKMFGWSDLEGTLDAVIEHTFETAGAHAVSGNLSLSAVSVKVPELDRPGIQFDKLAVVLDKIDVVKQHAAVADVSLTNLRIVADPKLPRLMLVLRPPKSAEAEPAPLPPRRRTGGAAEALDVEPGARPARARSWRPAGDPLLTLASTRRSGSGAPRRARRPSRVAAGLAHRALAASRSARRGAISALGLASRAPVAGGELLRGGRRADLAIALRRAPGVSAGPDLRVSGLGLAGLQVGRRPDRRRLEGLRAAEGVRVAPARGPRSHFDASTWYLVDPDVHLVRTEKASLPGLAAVAGERDRRLPTQRSRPPRPRPRPRSARSSRSCASRAAARTSRIAA